METNVHKPEMLGSLMGKSKSGSFWLATVVECDSTSVDSTEIDLSQYVDAGDRQGLLVEEVNYTFYDSSTNIPVETSSKALAVQIKDTTTGALVSYDSEHLVSSAALVYDSTGNPSAATDLYPDDMGWTKGQGRIVINGSLEVCGKADGTITNMVCAVRVRAKIITLTAKDYMAFALQSLTD